MESLSHFVKAAADGDIAELTRLHQSLHYFSYEYQQSSTHIDGLVYPERGFFEWVTALSEAARNGHLQCVQKLVEMGAGSDTDGGYDLSVYRFALEQAAVGGHMESFKFLVITRLFKSFPNEQTHCDLVDASKRGDFDSALYLLGVNSDENILSGWKGNSVMSLFIVCGCPLTYLQALIDLGVDVNGLDFNGLTPLMCAVLVKSVTIVRFLLHLGVEVNKQSIGDEFKFMHDGTLEYQPLYGDYGKPSSLTTALMYAASCSTDCLHELLCYVSEEDVTCVNGVKRSALTYAAYFGNTESVSLLLKAGAHVDLVEHVKNTGFVYFGDGFNIPHNAMLARNADSLELLLKVASKDCVLYTSSNVAVCLHDLHCLRVLLKYIENIDNIPYEEIDYHRSLLMQAALKGCVESVCLLLEHGADINLTNCYGETALMFSCDDKCENTLDILIEQGANVNIQNCEGNSAIIYSAINNAVNCLHKLASNGANIHIQNNSGETPLMIACAYGQVGFVKALIKLGVDVSIQNKTRQTATSYARHFEHDKCVEVLLAAGAALDTVAIYKDISLLFMSDKDEDRFLIDRNCLVYCGNLLLCQNGLLRSDRDKVSIFKQGQVTSTKTQLLLPMRVGIFNWDWCLNFRYEDRLDSIVFAALFFGICPARFKGKHPYPDIAKWFEDEYEFTPLFMAFCHRSRRYSLNSLRFILANRYFFPEDYRNLITASECITQYLKNVDHDYYAHYAPEKGDIYHKLVTEPLSLKTWSFLTVSKAVSVSGHPTGRPGRVDALPIPDRTKRELKFQTSISRLPPRFWAELSIEEIFDSLNFRNEIKWRWDLDQGDFNNKICDECDAILSRYCSSVQ